jgi:hypothetical protein
MRKAKCERKPEVMAAVVRVSVYNLSLRAAVVAPWLRSNLVFALFNSAIASSAEIKYATSQ